MIRKDFTLQNYVGTGGNCDARAVRCHERICRWHILCEHQLSHIPEYVKNQSQQNIQELSQTITTLNQFYDDTLARATVEMPDEQGNETLKSTYDLGCRNSCIQGASPIDYDGRELDNREDKKWRIGSYPSTLDSKRGTAEEEMRGLYILLTIDSDGGMEVLKYASRLYRDKPDVYHSPLVQLALSVYKV